jgi:uncharacterized protein YjbI with pentapeptide repeats
MQRYISKNRAAINKSQEPWVLKALFGNFFLAGLIGLLVFIASCSAGNKSAKNQERLENLRFVRSVSGFSDKPLDGIDLERANLSNLNLRGASLTRARLAGAVLKETVLDDSLLSEVHLSGSTIIGARFVGADLTMADFTGATIRQALFASPTRRATLPGANMGAKTGSGGYTRLNDLDFSDGNLAHANFSYARFTSVRLNFANLTRANLSYAVFVGSSLADANLFGADLRGTDLRGANLSGANLEAVCFNAEIRWPSSLPVDSRPKKSHCGSRAGAVSAGRIVSINDSGNTAGATGRFPLFEINGGEKCRQVDWLLSGPIELHAKREPAQDPYRDAQNCFNVFPQFQTDGVSREGAAEEWSADGTLTPNRTPLPRGSYNLRVVTGYGVDAKTSSQDFFCDDEKSEFSCVKEHWVY